MKHLSPAEIETIRVPEPKHDPFTLESLVAWAEKQPTHKRYDFWCDRCYLGQYFEAHGYQIDMIGCGTVTFAGHKTKNLPPFFNSIAMSQPHTFGAALTRARAALTSQNKGNANG